MGYKAPRSDIQLAFKAFSPVPVVGIPLLLADATVHAYHGEYEEAVLSGFAAISEIAVLAWAARVQSRAGREAVRSRRAGAPDAWVRPKGWRLPKNGKWSGTPGHSDFIPDNPTALGLKPGEVVPFRNGRPDFSKWSKGNFTSKEPLTGVHQTDMPKMIRTIAEEKGWTQQQVKDWLRMERLSPHHAGGNNVQLIPWKDLWT